MPFLLKKGDLMYIDKYREIIKSSVHRIPERLKQIDTKYFIVRNHQTCEFEVHHSGQAYNTLALNIPYQELDERILEKVRSTRIEYINEILKDMDNNNEKLEIEKDRKMNEVTETVTKDIYRYLKSHESKETIDEDSEYCKKAVG